jgi:hypothetical protein
MRDSLHTRRDVLRVAATTASVGSVVSLAGCQSDTDDGQGGDGGAGRIDLVPDGSRFAARIDVAGLLEDGAVRETANELIQQYGETGATVESLLDTAQQESGIDPRQLQEVLTFGVYDQPGRFAGLLWTGWTEDDLLALDERMTGSLTEDTYNGKTVYRGSTAGESLLAVLDDGVFAVGPGDSVEDAIDVWQGDADPVGGEVRSAYSSAAGGYARFGFDVPTAAIPAESGGQLDVSVFRSVTYGYGSLTADSTAFQFSLRAEDGSSADEIADLATAGKTLVESQIDASADQLPSGERERARRLVESTSVNQQGRTVTIRNTNGAEAAVLGMGAIVGSFVLGLGNTPSATAPQVAFEFEYDEANRALRITHTSGDHVAASQVYVRGSGAPTGSWQALGGSASGEIDGGPAVVAGDSLTLSDVGPDHEVSVVWESADGGMSATLAQGSGPGA